MNENSDVKKPAGLDKILWAGVIVLFLLATWSNYYFALPEHRLLPVLRIGGVVLAVVLALFLAAITQKGKVAINFAKEARVEMKKVVWPTRKETMQTTFVVAVITAIMAVLLWGFDNIMIKLVYFITTLGH